MKRTGFGISPKYDWLKTPILEFPTTVTYGDVGIYNERHFVEFLMRNDWIQRRIGIKINSCNGLFPDLKGEIYDGSGDPIMVEAEYLAHNYQEHKHYLSCNKCDLILSFIRKSHVRTITGVPIWSFYKSESNSDELTFCLYDDIAYDFGSHHLRDED
jgi:hypothetical protein